MNRELLSRILIGLLVGPALWVGASEPMIWAIPSARSGGFQPEPSFTVSALRAPAAIAKGETR